MIKNKRIFIFAFLPLLILVVVFFSAVTGSKDVGFFDALKALIGVGDDNTLMLVRQLRLPRIIISVIIGGGLAASGCVFQGILKNPLADPFTLGISGGAAFGTAVGFVSGLAAVSWLFVPFCAFLGALISVSAVYVLSAQKRFDPNSMILSGVIISYVFSSAVMLLFALSSANRLQAAFIWLMGNLSTFDERLLPAVSAIITAGTTALCFSGNIINAIALGGDKSRTLGMDIEKNVKVIFLTASLITAAAVSICGVIGFVGLMIPHIMRKIIGGNNSFLIPASAFAGAVFLPLCDTLGRSLFYPVVIPVGVITSIIGGVFFIFLLLRSDRSIL